MMIVDTNVVSEVFKPQPDSRVVQWLDDHAGEDLYITSTVLAELYLGIELLPTGRRRASLKLGIDRMLRTIFASRILPFDAKAAEMYAVQSAAAKSAGFSPEISDAQIAAVAAVHDASVVTRNVMHFVQFGVSVINPWEYGASE